MVVTFIFGLLAAIGQCGQSAMLSKWTRLGAPVWAARTGGLPAGPPAEGYPSLRFLADPPVSNHIRMGWVLGRGYAPP